MLTISTYLRAISALPLAALVLAVSACQVTTAADTANVAQTGDAGERLRRIEVGLRPAVALIGQPTVTYALADRMAHHQVPGVSVALIENGRIAWTRAYGVRQAGASGAVDTATLFQAASISKPVAAATALRLVEDGRLVLDRDVNLVLTSWKMPGNEFTAKRPVTLRDLLSHTAGTTASSFAGYALGKPVPTVRQVLDGEPPANSVAVRVTQVPGSGFVYSGGGYTIVQQLIADVTGRPFADVAASLVLQPTGMRRSAYVQPLPESLAANAAVGHRAGGAVLAGRWHTYPELAAAGLWTTAEDLARLATSILAADDGRPGVLKPATIKAMLTKQIPGFDYYGLGFQIDGEGRARRFSHGGVNDGYRTYLVGFHETNQGAAIMTNSDTGSELIPEILRALAVEYDWPKSYQQQKTVVGIDAASLPALVGRYDVEAIPGAFVQITANAHALYAEAPGFFPRRELMAEGEDRYFAPADGAEFAFERDAAGMVVAVTTTGGAAGDAKYRAARAGAPATR